MYQLPYLGKGGMMSLSKEQEKILKQRAKEAFQQFYKELVESDPLTMDIAHIGNNPGAHEEASVFVFREITKQFNEMAEDYT